MFSVQLPFETIDCWKLKNTHTCECCIDFLCLQQHLVTLSRSTLPPSLDQWSKLERDILIIDYVSWESLHRLAPLSISFTFAFHSWTFSFFFWRNKWKPERPNIGRTEVSYFDQRKNGLTPFHIIDTRTFFIFGLCCWKCSSFSI